MKHSIYNNNKNQNKNRISSFYQNQIHKRANLTNIYNDLYLSKLLITTNRISFLLDDILKETKTKIEKSLIRKSQNMQELMIFQESLSFYSKSISNISIKSYLEYLIKHTKPCESTLILMLYYIDRLCSKGRVLLLQNNIHKVLLASLIVTLKFNEDIHENNLYFSKLGGISISKLNEIELDFFMLCGCSLFYDVEKYNYYQKNIERLEDIK